METLETVYETKKDPSLDPQIPCHLFKEDLDRILFHENKLELKDIKERNGPQVTCLHESNHICLCPLLSD